MLRRILVVLAALSLPLAAISCGGDGDDGADEATTLSTTTTSEPETTAPAAEATDYCTFVAETTAPPDEDRDATLAYLERWRALAPPEIEDDIGVILEHARRGGFENEATPPDDVQAAVTAVTQYNLEACE